jgi:exopolyphosphatase
LQDCAGMTKNLEEYLIAVDNRNGLLRARATLVDHNHFYGTIDDNAKKMSGWTVTEIVDHHMDEGEHLQTCPPGPLRNIAFDKTSQTATVASMCTLIAERFFNASNGGTSPAMPPSLAILLLGVILLDSINMLPEAGKGTAREGNAIQSLLDCTDWTQPLSPSLLTLSPEIMDPDLHRPDPTKFFECLQAQKFSPTFWNGLSTLQALRLDYKTFPISTSSSDLGKEDDTDEAPAALGISTILLDVDTFWRTKQDIERTMYDEMKENNLLMLGLILPPWRITMMKAAEAMLTRTTPQTPLCGDSWRSHLQTGMCWTRLWHI